MGLLSHTFQKKKFHSIIWTLKQVKLILFLLSWMIASSAASVILKMSKFSTMCGLMDQIRHFSDSCGMFCHSFTFCTGWWGVKYQFTYLLIFTFIMGVERLWSAEVSVLITYTPHYLRRSSHWLATLGWDIGMRSWGTALHHLCRTMDQGLNCSRTMPVILPK